MKITTLLPIFLLSLPLYGGGVPLHQNSLGLQDERMIKEELENEEETHKEEENNQDTQSWIRKHPGVTILGSAAVALIGGGLVVKRHKKINSFRLPPELLGDQKFSLDAQNILRSVARARQAAHKEQFPYVLSQCEDSLCQYFKRIPINRALRANETLNGFTYRDQQARVYFDLSRKEPWLSSKFLDDHGTFRQILALGYDAFSDPTMQRDDRALPQNRGQNFDEAGWVIKEIYKFVGVKEATQSAHPFSINGISVPQDPSSSEIAIQILHHIRKRTTYSLDLERVHLKKDWQHFIDPWSFSHIAENQGIGDKARAVRAHLDSLKDVSPLYRPIIDSISADDVSALATQMSSSDPLDKILTGRTD